MSGKREKQKIDNSNSRDSRRYVLFSDVHGNYENMAAFTRAMYGFRSDRTFCLGDVVNHGDNYTESRTLDEVRKVPQIRMVKGNHDAILDGNYDFQKMSYDNVNFVRGLATQIREGNVLATHSSLREPGRRIRDEITAFREANHVFEGDKGLDFLFFGHTHTPAVYSYNPTTGHLEAHEGKRVEIQQGLKYLINPGTLGVMDTEEVEHTFAVVDEKKGEILRYTTQELKEMDSKMRAIRYFNGQVMPNLRGDAWTPRTLQPHIQRLQLTGLNGELAPIKKVMERYGAKPPTKKRALDKFSLELATEFSKLMTENVRRNYGVFNPLEERERLLE